MAENKLPSMETIFHVHMTGEETGQTFDGQFKYHRPTIGDRTQIDVRRAIMSRDQANIAATESDTLYILAFLYVTIKDSPDWWKDNGFGSMLYDLNVIMGVYEECMKFEKEWKEKVKGKSDALPKATVTK